MDNTGISTDSPLVINNIVINNQSDVHNDNDNPCKKKK